WRFAVLLHNALEFQEVPACMCVHRYVQILRGDLAGAQQRLATGLDLSRVEHATQAPLRGAIVGADEIDGGFESLLASGGVGIVVDASLRIRISVAVAERWTGVGAHTQGFYEMYIAFPIAALSPDVNDGRRTVLEGVQEDIGAQGGDDLRWWGAHLAFEGGGKTQVVRGTIGVLHHVVEHVVPAVASGVHMRVDKAGRHELATCGEAQIYCTCIRTASVHN